MGSAPKTSDSRGACIGKAEDQPCNVTDDNPAPDCYESMHAFKKIRTSTSGLRKSPNKWTKEENQKLASLVASYGEKKWKRISAEMGGQKTGAQCAQHWKRVLSPEIRKGHWDENEEDLLLRLVVQYGSCWKKIAKKIPQRTDIQCRYQYLKAKQSREVLWDAKEDESLIKKVMEMANCNFFQVLNENHANGTYDNTNGPNANTSTSTTTPLRSSSNYNTTASPPSNGNSTSSNSINTSADPNKENDGALSSSGGSDAKEDECQRMKLSGERGKDAWNDDKKNVNMSDSSKDTGNSWRSGSKEASSLSGTCANCHSPVGAHVNKIVWLEISEHMARLKLTSTLRTALECKTRFTELLGNKLSLSGSQDFCLNSSSESNKSFGLKNSGDIGGLGFGNTLGGSGGIDKGFHNTLSDANIGIKINSNNLHNKINSTSSTPNANGCNSNNINLTNCNNNNITINITNSYTTANTNQNGVNFQQIAHCANPESSVKMEHSSPIPAHLLSKTPIPPILSPAPPFPSFSSFPHLPQPTSLKPASVRTLNVHTSGLESLAAVASILPREMLADYHF